MLYVVAALLGVNAVLLVFNWIALCWIVKLCQGEDDEDWKTPKE